MGSIGEYPPPTPQTWVETPLFRSTPLSRYAGCNIYLKLETLQPSSSFKSRGIGNLMTRALLSYPPSTPLHFYCSSGGNAGLACATAALSLRRPSTIVVPETTSQFMVEKLRSLCPDVRQTGAGWVEADQYLRGLMNEGNEGGVGVYVPPFDDERIWEGNSTVVDEIESQMSPFGGYDAIVCSVGGGGLFAGIMQGLEKYDRLSPFTSPTTSTSKNNVKVLAVETHGTASLSLSLQNASLSRLPKISSIATSLGAPQVAARAFELASKYQSNVESVVLSDAEAAMGSVCFADDERVLVEAACGVSVATGYNGCIRERFGECSDREFAGKNVVVVVCGGSNVSLGVLEKYRGAYMGDEGVLGGVR
ncbi:tryptophan synthase beta subunit-like PLP-dependent enzyme [Amylocarpus encephaloides]|uniref:L-serine ammonia-lyase n=1 Tax=Amylocarpus encephaloides TaxID=45428 RepID=A0A9P7YFE8_9HELO|nr:tryptophan synthase beta subunit-like PLP-dependent enzyme [Amylocarpus encephaloides]